MHEKVLAIITEEERDVIQALYERINSIKSLLPTLSVKKLNLNDQDLFYEKISNDWYDTNQNYNYWWQNIVEKYNLDKKNREMFHLNFEEMTINLIF